MDVPCPHLDWLRVTSSSSRVCGECGKLGLRWVHLRLCLTCGFVGCCDNSPGRHASRHFQDSGHPLMRSLEPGEGWAWCHLDRFAFVPDWEGLEA